MSVFDSDIDLFDRPIPGQGLTANPDSPPPWRRPPRFSNPDEAYQYIMQKLTDPAHLGSLCDVLRKDVSISLVVENLLKGMFIEGMITNQMILKLAKPVMQAVYVIALQAGIEPKVSHKKSRRQKQQAQIDALKMAEEMDMSEDQAVNLEDTGVQDMMEETPEMPQSLLGAR